MLIGYSKDNLAVFGTRNWQTLKRNNVQPVQVETPEGETETHYKFEQSILSEAEAESATGGYRPWAPWQDYTTGDLRQYGGKSWECVQNHRSQPDWAPNLVPALWKLYSDEITEWRQPAGAHDVYHVGDRVLYDGQIWECIAGDASGANSWEPGVYGWEVAV